MRSSASPRAVSSRIGVVMRSRRLAVSSSPSSPGIITSSTRMSNSSPSSRLRAWRGVAGDGHPEAVARQELLQERRGCGRRRRRRARAPAGVSVMPGRSPASRAPGRAARGRSSPPAPCGSRRTASGPALEKAARMRRRWAAESSCSSSAARLGQLQVALAAVLAPDPALDQPVLDQLAQHPVQALLGDAEDLQELVDRQPRAAVDEVDRPVVRPAVAALARGCGRGRR